MKIKLRSKYFLKIFIFSIIIGIIPVVLLSFFSYQKASNTIKVKTSENNMQMFLQTQLRIEERMKIIDYNCIQLINSSVLLTAMNKKLESQDYQLISELTNNLTHIQVSDIQIEDVILLNYQNSWLLSTTASYYMNHIKIMEAYKKYLDIDGNFFWVIQEEIITNSRRKTAGELEKNYYVNLIRKIQTIYGVNTGLLIVKLKIKEIIDFSGFNEYPSRNFIVLDLNNSVVWHNNESFIGQNFSMSDYVKKVDLSGGVLKGNYNIKMNKDKYDVIYIKSDYNGWLYFFITPTDYIIRDANYIGWYILGICAVIVFLICLISFQGSKKIYYPVKRLYEIIGKNQHFILQENEKSNETDEFEFINKRVQELMNNQNEMMNKIKLQSEQVIEYLLFKLLKGEIKSEEIVNKVEFFSYYSNWTWMCVIALEIDTLEGTKFAEEDKEVILFTINKMVNELIPGNKCIKPIIVNNSQVTIIGTEQESKTAFKEYAYSLSDMLQKYIVKLLGIKVSIGISNPFKKIEDINVGYKESIEALKHRILLGQEIIIFYEDIKNDQKMIPSYPFQVESNLINALRIGDIQDINYYFDQFINEVFSNKLNYMNYQLYIGRLVNEIVFLVINENESLQTTFNKQIFLYEKLITIKTREELEFWIKKEIIEPIINLMKEKRLNQQKKIAQEMIRIIQEKYDTDLTLDTCARHLNYSPKYLSAVFYNEIGKSFSEYLKQYRLDIAKQLLIENNMKIFDIAQKLRYANSQNFIRCFKKNIGLTPLEYREKYKNNT